MMTASLATLRLEPADLLIGGALVAATLILLYCQGFGLAREVGAQTLRALVQVLLVGFVLASLTNLDRWYWVVATLFVMTLIATHRASAGITHPIPFLKTIAVGAIGTTVLVVVGFLAYLVLDVRPWYSPLYLVPLTGMVLANAMNGFNLFVQRLATGIRARQDEVEIKLSLGADVRESVRGPMREALRTALLPLGNLLLVVGVVQIPGIMAGQLFADAAPMTAACFAILMIEAAVASVVLSVLLAGALTYRLFFTPALQLKESV